MLPALPNDPDMRRLTVFARIAIVAGCVFILLHLWLMARTPWRPGDAAIVLLGLATVAGYVLIRSRRTVLTRLLVRTAFVWTGLASIAGFLFLISALVEFLGPTVDAVVVWVGSLAAGVWGFLRARNPIIRRRRLTGPYNAPVRVLQLTDIHIGDIWSPAHLGRIIDISLRQQPDVVVVTGDLLDGMEPVDPVSVQPFARFDVPVYFVSGNHDSYTRRDELLKCLRRVGVVPLEGAIHCDERLSVLGLAYGMPPESADDLLARFRSMPRPRIVLKHKPDRLDALLTASPDAVLCGHVHGGQIWPFGHLARLEFPHADGTKKVGRTLVHVSQGTATWGPPFRSGTCSEITVFDFIPE